MVSAIHHKLPAALMELALYIWAFCYKIEIVIQCNFVMKIFKKKYSGSQKHVLYFIGQVYNWYYS